MGVSILLTNIHFKFLISDLCSELIFSPVLLWRPGRAQCHPPPPSASAHEISNEKTRRPNQSSITHPTNSSPPHPLPRPQHTPPPATHVAAGSTHKDKDRSVRRIQAENLSTGRKGPLLIKTTDLTDALPPQQSFESPLHNENKVPYPI